jgi:O-antigen/teichoic acid export membrane protein
VRRLIRSTALLGLGSVATVVAAILRAKVLALIVGPHGTGLLAQLSTLTAFLVPLATLGLGNGVVAMIAAARARGDHLLAARVQSTALTISWIVGLGLAALAALASPLLSDVLYHDRAWTWVVIAGAVSVPLSAVGSLRVSILQGHQAVKTMAILNGVVAAATVATIVPLAWIYGLKGAVVQLVILASIQLVVTGWMVARVARAEVGAGDERGRAEGALAATTAAAAGAAGADAVPPPRPPRIDRALLRPLLRYGSSALLVGMCATLTVLILRSVLVQKLGLEANGIYQVCIGISSLYMPLILNSITAIVWPQIASQRTNEETAATMRQALRLGLLLMTGASGAMLAGAPIWIPVFYSGKFLPAQDVLPIEFLGDYFRTVAWMCAIWLVPKNRLKPWVLFDLVYAVAMLVTFWLLVDRVGLKSVVIAYVVAHVSHAVLNYALARKALGFRVGRDNRRLLLASLVLLAGLTVWTPRTPLGTALALLALAAWALIAVRPDEWRAVWRRARLGLAPPPRGDAN